MPDDLIWKITEEMQSDLSDAQMGNLLCSQPSNKTFIGADMF